MMTNGVFSSATIRRLVQVGAACAAASMVGCASTTVDNLETANRSLTERNTVLQRDLEEANAEIAILREQRQQADQTVAHQGSTIDDLRNRLGLANTRFEEFSNRLSGIQLADLDPQTDRALREIAARFPDKVQYDPQRGMLRFSSDLTFDSGSDIVKSEAEASLAALAEVLTSTAASPYEIHVVGHTDSQPISSGTAQRHPTNMHLACHRAIAVRRFLVNAGVAPEKIMAAGWGEQRPIVPNTNSGNTPANRRVEVYLTKVSGTFAGAPGDDPATRMTEVDPTK